MNEPSDKCVTLRTNINIVPRDASRGFSTGADIQKLKLKLSSARQLHFDKYKRVAMDLQLSTLIWLLASSAIITGMLGFYAWKHRAMPGATPFALMMFTGVFWAVLNALEMSGKSLSVKLIWANLQYFVYETLPLYWLALVLQFTGRERWLTRRNILLLLTIPAGTLVLVWTNPLHGLMRQNVFLDTSGSFPVIAKTYGTWAYLQSFYAYGLLIGASYLLIRSMQKAEPNFQVQLFLLLIGVSIPLIWNVVYVFGISPIQRHDVSPAVLSLSGAIVSWGLFRYRMFDIVPVAQDAILRSITDGVVVIDNQGHIAAINPAAEGILGGADSIVGMQVDKAFAGWPVLSEFLSSAGEIPTEVILDMGRSREYFELSLSPLLDHFGQEVGRLLILHNITSRKQVEEELYSLSTTDPLTGLANRRKFVDRLKVEIQRSRRYDVPLSLILIDVNGLKQINDTLGHPAGDEALCIVANVLKHMRQTDLAARLGGDEFVLLLPSTTSEGAQGLSGRLLEALHRMRLEGKMDLSMSLGIAALEKQDDEEGESLLARADEAMYEAKQSGQGYKLAERS